MKAFLGTGLLGSGFVKAMLQKGEQVQVWNRTVSKAQKLEDLGAEVFKEANDAVANADFVHVCLKDDASVEEVLEKARIGFKAGAIIVDHTTTSVSGAIDRTNRWRASGFIYQHAPVLMGPKNALESTGFMLVSGDQSVIKKLEPELSEMTGELLNFGPSEGRAAGMKLIGNLFLMAFTGGISDALGLAKSLAIPTADLLKLFSAWNPGSITGRLKRMSSDLQQTSWELNMARKDARLMMEEANKDDHKLMVIPAIAEEMDQWIEKGHGKDNWTVFASDNI